jgi:hypothetical protein
MTPTPNAKSLRCHLAHSRIVSFSCRRRCLFGKIVGILSLFVFCNQTLYNFLGFIELAETIFEGHFTFVALKESVTFSERGVLRYYSLEECGDTCVIRKHKSRNSV